jgi:putative addiction module killer protein
MQRKIVTIYKDESGIEPYTEWLNNLNGKEIKVRIKDRVQRVAFGNLGDCKYVGNNIFELRLHFGSGYRVYFSQTKRVVILLLCGGDKRSQRKDIIKAKKYLADYRNLNL